MARNHYTATFPAAHPGDEVTWAASARVYLDSSTQRTVAAAYLNESKQVSLYTDAASLAVTCGNETLTLTTGSPTQSGAAVSVALELPTPTTGDAGKVATVKGTEDGYELAIPSGGSVAVRHYVVPFAYNTPNLNVGVGVFTPTVDDELLDMWIEVITAWDGSDETGFPQADVFQLSGHDEGIFNRAWGGGGGVMVPIDLTSNDFAGTGQGLALLMGGNETPQGNQQLSMIGMLSNLWTGAGANAHARYAPSKFLTADPFKLVVSMDGKPGGAAPAATQGAARLHILVSTPEELATF